MYPVCTVWNCWTNFTHHFSLPILIFWPFYTLAKIFVYLIFIGRLFNPYYARIHQCSKCIKYLLWIFVWVLVIETIAYKIQDGLLLAGIDVPLSVDKVLTVIYSILDVLLSVLCMSLFFLPIWSRSARNSNVYMSVAKRYGFISALQMIAAITFQLTWLGGT